MRKKELLWLLAFPVFYLLNAMRHEMAHAFLAGMEGAQVTSLAFWPRLNASGQIASQTVHWQGQVSWMVAAAPYLIDLLTFLVFFYFCMAVPFQRRWIWLNLVVIGLVSPFLNSLVAFFSNNSDMLDMLQALSPGTVNIFFLLAFLYYGLGLILVFGFSRTVMPSIPEHGKTIKGES